MKTNLLLFLFISASLISCSVKYPVQYNHRIGDTYRVTGDLYSMQDKLVFESWFDPLDKNKHNAYKFEKGVLFKIANIDIVTKSSWNTGAYSYPELSLEALTGGKKGQVFDGRHIVSKCDMGIEDGKTILEKVPEQK